MMSRIAAAHVHSEWSYDASWTLRELAAAFRKRGCDLVLMTEHDRGWDESRWRDYANACREASGNGILMVPGTEYSDPRNDVHVLVWGADRFLGENLETAQLLALVEEAGGVAVLAHPERRAAWKLVEPAWFDRLLGVEVWNRKYDGWATGRHGTGFWQRYEVAPFAALDFHRKNQFFPLRMQLEIADDLSPETVSDALRSRRVQPLFIGRPLAPTLSRGGPSGTRTAERVRRVLRRVIPH